MADPAAASPPRTGRQRWSRRGPGRLAGILLAAVVGVVAVGIGVARTAAGPAGADPNVIVAVGPSRDDDASPLAGTASPGSAPSASPAAPAPTPNPPSTTAPPPGPGAKPPTDPGRSSSIRDRLQRELDRLRIRLAIPGVSATVILPDGTSWTGVSGLADVAARAPVTADTAFAYASISKTFTSAVILQLVDEGRLRLTDSAAGLLPPLRIKIDRRITIGMLLDHTSGLADYFLNPKIDRPLQSRPGDAWTIDRTLGYVGKRLSPPGAAWHYSNTNYLLLGLIAERATGKPLAMAIRERLLEPAGLTATWYQAVETARSPVAHGYRFVGTKRTAKPIDLTDGSGTMPFRSVVTAAAGAGSIAGTSGDLARWARALYGGDVLGPTGTAMLLSGFSKTTSYLPGVAYGYGVQAVSIDGHPSLGHSGRLLGFRSVARHFPLEGLTIAVLTNQSRADPGVILRALLAEATRQPIAPICRSCAVPS